MIASTGPNPTSRQKPNTWQVETLGTIASLKSGFAYRSQDWVESGVPVIKIANVRDGRVSLEGCSHVTEEVAADTAAFRVLNGDLLMTLTGEIGAIGVYQGAIPARLNQRVARIDIDEKGKVLFEFLFHYLESPHVREHLWSKAQGMAQPNISPKEVLRVPISIPSIAEQQEIVGILEEQFSRLDAAAASIAAVRRKADQFRRSILHAAFSGGLTQLGAGGMKEVQLPAGWSRCTLSDVADITMGQSPPSSAYNDHGVGLPFFQGKAEFGQTYPTVKKWTTEGNKRAYSGDILMSVRAPVGPTNIADTECVIGRGLAAIRAREQMNQTFLLWFLRGVEDDIASRGTGTTFDSISGDSLRKQPVCVPLLPEQAEIVRILEEQFSRQEAILTVADAADRKVAALRRSLLHAAFSGELTKLWREKNNG